MHLSAICFHFLERRNEKPQKIEKRREEKKKKRRVEEGCCFSSRYPLLLLLLLLLLLHACYLCKATNQGVRGNTSRAATIILARVAHYAQKLSQSLLFFFAKSEWRRRADDIYFCNVCVWVCQHDHRAYRNNARARAGRCAAHLKRCVCYLCCLT